MSFAPRVLRTLSVNDPAIDLGQVPTPALVEFYKLRDAEKLKLIPAEKPVWFSLAEISHRVMTGYVLGAGSDAELQLRAFQAAIVKVENLRQDDGPRLPVWEPTRAHGIAADEVLERFSTSELMEMGAVAYHHSFFRPPIRPPYPLPPMCLYALAERVALHAEPNPSTAPQSNENQSSLSEEVPPQAGGTER